MFTIVSEWLELLKLVNIYLIKGRIIVLQIKLRWTWHLPALSTASLLEKLIKKAQFILQDIPDSVDLTSDPDLIPSTTPKLRVCQVIL